MLANRLRKNISRLGPWAKREGLEAWRVYDRDIPEFPWLIDLYGDHVLASEHMTPTGRRQTHTEREAEREAVRAAVHEVFATPPERFHLKTRERHLSLEREARGTESHEFAVGEGGHRFLVNLDDYLDTGLFLDHRAARARIGKAAENKRVLNLFCYTAAFSVYAATGGASTAVSVDLSATYLAWGERNFRLNGIDPAAHPLVRADVFDYLATARDTFDLIVLDPPTLSRSKKGRSFDVQDAHVDLVRRSYERLSPGGTLLFSTNYRRFALDDRALSALAPREITHETHPKDFRDEIHRAWEFTRK